MRQRLREFKPLLFTTTMRNPNRLKALLYVLANFNNQTLTNELCTKIMGELIRYGLYCSQKSTESIKKKWGLRRKNEQLPIGIELLKDEEVEYILKNNPQLHKEAGFDKGWPSRFATIFDLAKEFGFVYYKIGDKIEFSKLGEKLINSIEIKSENGQIIYSEIDALVEQAVFCNSLAKYQRNNPFVRVLNNNVPLILLLQVIKKLNEDTNFNSIGISILELPLLIWWKDNNAESLYQRIKLIRENYGYNPSWEVIIEICINEIMGGNFKKFKPKSIMLEYPDEFIRKMRLTGLISLRGGGRFVDINKTEIEKINYILNKYSNFKNFEDEKEWFNYISKIDERLISEPKKLAASHVNKLLDKWIEMYNWEKIKAELLILIKKRITTDNILKYLNNSVRLEFLISLAVKSKFPAILVLPNYICDDEGIPTSTAIGGKADIECFNDNDTDVKGFIIEVTMSEGRTQTVMEVWPIARHLEEFKEKYIDAFCYFIAPTIYKDSLRQIAFLASVEQLVVKTYSIIDFVEFLENGRGLSI
jgi:hypothetical protein